MVTAMSQRLMTRRISSDDCTSRSLPESVSIDKEPGAVGNTIEGSEIVQPSEPPIPARSYRVCSGGET